MLERSPGSGIDSGRVNEACGRETGRRDIIPGEDLLAVLIGLPFFRRMWVDCSDGSDDDRSGEQQQ